MKTKNQLKAFFGLGALSLLTAASGGLTTGCVADRPSRNSVFDENQYIRKDWLVRPGDSTNPDYGWLLKATITDASEPNVFGGDMYNLFAGSHSQGELVHFVITSDQLEMLDNQELNSTPSVGRQPEVVNAWPVVNVDLKYLINLDGEKTNQYGESQELDWQVRQWVKLTLDKNNMSDLAPLGPFANQNIGTCTDLAGTSATLVPNSFIVDEAHDYMEWTIQVTLPIMWTDTCYESYGVMGATAAKLGRQYETVNLKYSMVRSNPSPLQGSTSYAENSAGAQVPAYQPLTLDEKDPIQHKYSPILLYSWNEDPDTGLLSSQKFVTRHNPAKDQRWYFEEGFPDQYKNVFTSHNLPPGVSPLPPGIPTIEDSTNQLLVQANAVNPSATGRLSFHEYNEPLDDGTPINRTFGDVRFNMLRWVQSYDQQNSFAGVTSFVTDPRTGEALTSDIVLENFQIKDYYVERIDAYLQTIGASPGLYTSATDWTNPTSDGTPGGTQLVCNQSTIGQTVPIVPATVLQNHNGQSTLYQKIQGYLYKPAAQYGPLGPQNFIVPQDADFLHAYFAYLPYIIYADPTTNPYVTPESGATNTGPTQSALMWNMISQEQQFHALAASLDQGQSPYNPGSSTGSQDAIDFMNTYKQMSINHHAYTYAQAELNTIIAAQNGGATNNFADNITDFAMESVMAKDARQCVGPTLAIPTAHWETKQEWIDSLTQTYWSQVMWHEFGHSQGLTHNFIASVDKNNFPVELDANGNPILDSTGAPKYKLNASSVMEYNAVADRVFWGAGWAPYDVGALTWMYANNGSTPPAPTLAQGAVLPISGQASSSYPWKDPNGFQADGKTEIQFLVCNESHIKYTPLCKQGDLGITPSEITANELDNYEWQYAWRNFRTYHKIWDDSNYADQPLNFVTEERRFQSLASYDMSAAELITRFAQIGVQPPPDAPSAVQYYNQLTDKFSAEMGGALDLTGAFHEAIIEQSSGQRPYITQFDNYYGDVTLQGITLDKLDALESFLALWPVDNYDQTQAAGAYISSFSPTVGPFYETVAEQAAVVMIGGNYAAFPYFGPLGDAIFTQDTHTVEYLSYGGREDVKDWTGGWLFTRLSDFLSFFQNIAVQNNFQVPQDGINCDTLADCNYDPRTPQAYANQTFYSTNTNQFTGPDGRRYIWAYIQSRNEFIVCDQDRHIATFNILYTYTLDVIQGYDDGYGGAYGLETGLLYFIDYYMEFNGNEGGLVGN